MLAAKGLGFGFSDKDWVELMTDLSRVVCFCNPDPKFLLTMAFGLTEDFGLDLTSTLASGFLTGCASLGGSSGIVKGGGLGFSTRALGFVKNELADFLCLVAYCNFPTI